MKEGLISADIKKSLEDIVRHCFYINRIADRIVSILSVKFVMPNLAELYHLNYAHWAPSYADKITEYMDARDCTTIYGETPIGNQEYEAPLDCLNKSLEMNLDLEVLLKNAIVVAKDESDYTTMVFLEEALRDVVPITKDILILVDKAEMYGDTSSDWMKLDHDVDKFPIFGNK